MSKVTAVAYYSGIPAKNNNPEKPLILDNFLQGVRVAGDTAIAHRGFNVVSSDVALIQGFVHEDGKTAPHLQLRQQAIDLQKRNNKRSLIVDSNLFLYRDPGNTKTYLRYSFDGVFPTTGFYFDKDVDPARWQKISKNIGITLKDYRVNGNHILVCLQRNGGWSMRGMPAQQWLDNTILEIKKHTQRPIIVRTHPGDKKIKKILKIKFPNVRLSTNLNLSDDLQNAWATVFYNSSPGVASIIEGVPVFLTDPFPEHSQSNPVANKDLSKIELPVLFQRQEWIEKLSMCHWNFDELRSGEAWNFFKRYV
jgi:hypothetical protein